MPYSIRAVGGGFKVFKAGTSEAMSKKPLSKAEAIKQLAALEMSMKKEGK